jgi:starch synthase (maltosyl-transferring)
MPHDYPFKVEDLLSGINYDWNGEWNYVAVNPGIMPAHLFRVTLT